MDPIARWEYKFLIIVTLLFVLSLLPALHFQQQERRDGIRRAEVISHKKTLEQYFNVHAAYPLEFNASPHQYVVEEVHDGSAIRWYLRAELENMHPETQGFDEEYNVYYRFVRDDVHTFYDVCGAESHCGVTRTQ